MSTSGQFYLSVEKELEKFGKDIEDLGPALTDAINETIGDIAKATYAQIVAKAQSELHSTKQAYLSGLEFNQFAPNSYIISLKGARANQIEEGMASRDLTEILLNSDAKVKRGPNAGEDWVKKSKKDQHKYAHVPFDHTTTEVQMNLPQYKGLNQFTGKQQRITQIFKKLDGSVAQGKVWSGLTQRPGDLAGLTKFQVTNPDTQKTNSYFMTWRTISEASKHWVTNPIPGLKAFDAAEQHLEEQVDKILTDLFKDF